MNLRALMGSVFGLCWMPAVAFAECDAGVALDLPDPVRELLRAEMQQMAGGMTALSLHIASGEWDAVRTTAAGIRDGYIMAGQLTPSQREALEHALPDGFRKLDQTFHRQADRLAESKGALDPQWAGYQLSRLVEGCAECHAGYARERFPGFDCQAPAGHHH